MPGVRIPLANSERNQRREKKPGEYIGVSKTRHGRWRAVIYRDGKLRLLGVRATAEEAARLYDGAARERDGEYAVTNFTGREVE